MGLKSLERGASGLPHALLRGNSGGGWMRMTGGELLAWFRQQYGLSQQQLADRIDSSRSMIAQIEQGTRQPSSKLLAALSQTLQLGDEEQAMLFLAYDKVQSGQDSMLPYIVATLRLDCRLSSSQVESLIDLVAQEYEAAIQANDVKLISEYP